MAGLDIRELRFRDRGPYTLHIEPGECLGLQGASGAGKSLLLRAIADLDVRTGQMRLGELDADAVAAPVWRRAVGLLPAESGWWADAVGEHFADFAEVDEGWLTAAGFDRRVQDWQISRLSTGEKQRLAIVRLLANRPGCLLLDEPTASLDQAATLRIETLLLRYAADQGAPVLWISHDPAQVQRVARRRLFLDAQARLVPGEGGTDGG